MTAKLLVADDSVTIQKIVGLAFSEEDVVIEAVSSGDGAMDTARVFKPDVVLADVFMPGMSGYEVCESIKDDPELAETPVILLVGTFEPFDESEAARVKCDGHLTKPFDTSELIEMVRSLVGDKMMPQNSETPIQSLSEEAELSASTKPPSNFPNAKGLVNPGVLDSYLGTNSVVEMFDPETRAAAHALSLLRPKQDAAGDSSPESETMPESGNKVSENLLNLIVERVMSRMSSDVIREVAWEVVPELSEVLLRRVIEEQNQS